MPRRYKEALLPSPIPKWIPDDFFQFSIATGAGSAADWAMDRRLWCHGCPLLVAVDKGGPMALIQEKREAASHLRAFSISQIWALELRNSLISE